MLLKLNILTGCIDYDKIPYEDLQSLLGTSVALANNLYDEQVSEILLLEE